MRDALEGLDLWGVVNCGGFGGEIATPMDTDIAIFDKVIAHQRPRRAAGHQIRLAVDGAARQGRRRSSTCRARPAWWHCRGTYSYGSSKAALDNITRVSALELGKYDIRVNSVNPTVVMTPISSGHWSQPEVAEPFLDQMPLGRWATEDEIAAPIVFLLSDAASMITGVSLPIDGGYTCR